MCGLGCTDRTGYVAGMHKAVAEGPGPGTAAHKHSGSRAAHIASAVAEA